MNDNNKTSRREVDATTLVDVSDCARPLGIGHRVIMTSQVWNGYAFDERKINRDFNTRYLLQRLKAAAEGRLSWPSSPLITFRIPFFDTDDVQPSLCAKIEPNPEGRGMIVLVMTPDQQ